MKRERVITVLDESELGPTATFKTKARKSVFPLWTTLPTLMLLLMLFVYPIGRMLLTSVVGTNGLTAELYAQMFRDRVYVDIIFSTFRISFVVTILCLVLGYPVAYFATVSTRRVRNLILLATLLPFMLDFLVRNYSWMILLGRFGFINRLLLLTGLVREPLQLMHNSFAVYVGMVQIQLPLMVLTLFSVMRGIDRNLLRAAHASGANSVRSWLHVFWPLSLPGVIGGSLLTFVTSLAFFITPALLGGRGDVMITQWIVILVTTILDWRQAASLSVLLLAATLVILVLYNRWFGVEQLWGRSREE